MSFSRTSVGTNGFTAHDAPPQVADAVARAGSVVQPGHGSRAAYNIFFCLEHRRAGAVLSSQYRTCMAGTSGVLVAAGTASHRRMASPAARQSADPWRSHCRALPCPALPCRAPSRGGPATVRSASGRPKQSKPPAENSAPGLPPNRRPKPWWRRHARSIRTV